MIIGRLYQKTVSGKKTLAYFERDRVRSGRNAAECIAGYNNIGQISLCVSFNGDSVIANCDISGNIRKGGGLYGRVLAKCEDGIIFEGSDSKGKILAHFDGDMYGAAAALAVVVLQLPC